jgi:hypothetical protein
VEYTVTGIGGYAFWNCAGLTDISLPWKTVEGIVTPDADSFKDTAKGDITLHVPADTKSIYTGHEFWNVEPGGFKAIIEIVDPDVYNITYGPGGDDQKLLHR